MAVRHEGTGTTSGLEQTEPLQKMTVPVLNVFHNKYIYLIMGGIRSGLGRIVATKVCSSFSKTSPSVVLPVSLSHWSDAWADIHAAPLLKQIMCSYNIMRRTLERRMSS